ncbi:MAG: hypothetical protein ACXWPM_07235 [Bdellovibrionota bacterium]
MEAVLSSVNILVDMYTMLATEPMRSTAMSATSLAPIVILKRDPDFARKSLSHRSRSFRSCQAFRISEGEVEGVISRKVLRPITEKSKDMDSSALTSRKPVLKTLLVAILCLLGAGYFSVRLYDDFNASGAAGVGKPLAKVSRRAAKVRRKAAKSYVWSNVKSGEDLYKKDSVQTSAGSAAAIQFEDGSTLEVGENSLVVIDDLTNLSLNFLRGQIVVRDKNGEDKRISVGQDGKAKIEELPIRLSFPTPQSYFWTAEKTPKPIKFAWEAHSQGKPDERYILQISSTRDFRADKTQTFTAANASVREYTASLLPGSYFWRVIGGAGGTAETRQFRVLPVVAMKPVFPAAQQKVVAYGQDGALQFRLGNLKLPAVDGVDPGELQSESEHRIEVARDVEFKNIDISEKVDPSSGVAAIKGLGEGVHYWRIKSRYGDVTAASAATKFQVEKTAKPTLELNSPPASATVELHPQLRFNWYCETAKEFEYVIDIQSPDGRSVLSSKSKAFAFLWKNPSPGAYRWRVSALAGDQAVVQSEWRAFSIVQGAPLALKKPAKNSKLYYWSKPEDFELGWSPDSLVADHEHSYVLELSQDPGFKTIGVSKALSTNQLSSSALNLTSGLWNWRVRLVDKDRQTVKTSETFAFNYGLHPVLGAPQGAKPDTGAAYNLLDMEDDPVLSWAPVEGATQYEVIVFQEVPARTPASAGGKAQNKQLLRSKISGTSFALKDLKPGKYQWTVRAIDPISRPGELLPYQKLQMSLGDPLAPPESLTPEVQ